MLNGKKIVVTGGTGFIGKRLLTVLEENNEVTNVDIRNKKKPRDILGNLKNECEGADYVFHLAAQVSVPKSIVHSEDTYETNIRGTFNVLKTAYEAGVKKVVLSSSAAVYGETNAHPVSEKEPLFPISPYAVSKVAGEQLARCFSEQYGLDTISLRYFNVYGPNQENGVIPRFCMSLLTNQRPLLYEGGVSTRDFVYVDDVVKANLLAAVSHYGGEYNIGTGEPTSVLEVWNRLEELSGKTAISPVFVDARKGDIKHSCADIGKANKDLRYSPGYTFAQGLEETWSWATQKQKGRRSTQ